MRLLRWFIRFIGMAFLSAVYAACFALLLYPRWWTATAAATIAIACTCAGLLLIVASFMPKLDMLKQHNAQRRQPQPGAARVDGTCSQCPLHPQYQCNAHSKAFCRAHANEHIVAGCGVGNMALYGTEAQDART